MSIISVIDNENNRWKRNTHTHTQTHTHTHTQTHKQTNKQTNKQKRQKRTSGTEAIVKEWELNDFVMRLS